MPIRKGGAVFVRCVGRLELHLLGRERVADDVAGEPAFQAAAVHELVHHLADLHPAARWPGRNAHGNLREARTHPLGNVLDSGCAGYSAKKSERPNRRETTGWTCPAKRIEEASTSHPSGQAAERQHSAKRIK